MYQIKLWFLIQMTLLLILIIIQLYIILIFFMFYSNVNGTFIIRFSQTIDAHSINALCTIFYG